MRRGSVTVRRREPAPLVSRTLPRPVRWLIWLGIAALLSVLAGFAMGLARPRVKAA
jgi:hypothetical protein